MKQVRVCPIFLLALACSATRAGTATNRNGTRPVAAVGNSAEHWVGTWSSAQQLTEPNNTPPTPGLTDNTLRQIVHVSIGGRKLRIHFSNEYGSSPVSLSKVHCALSAGRDSIAAGTDVALQFNGSTSVTIAPHQAITSDPVEFLLPPLTDLAVSIRFGSTPLDITGHPGSRTTSYIEQGDAVSSPSLNASATVDHWYILSGVEIEASRNTSALVTLGDSITDGRGSTTNGNDRWPDELARRLQADTNTEGVAILNQSIGGNAVTAGGLGPTAQLRFEHDVLNPRGVRWLIVFEGVNDIGSANDSGVASALVNAYTQFVKRAHAANIKVYGATITPFNGHSYYSPEHENARQAVNAWIRAPGHFDAVIDFDQAVRDPARSDALLAAYDTGDHLHLNPAGYKAMAHAVDLSLFSPPDR